MGFIVWNIIVVPSGSDKSLSNSSEPVSLSQAAKNDLANKLYAEDDGDYTSCLDQYLTPVAPCKFRSLLSYHYNLTPIALLQLVGLVKLLQQWQLC